jgi:hypothetical protein
MQLLAEHHVGVLEVHQRPRRPVGGQFRIRAEKRDRGRMGHGDAQVARLANGHTSWADVDAQGERQGPAHPINFGEGAIRTAGIDHDDLEAGGRLLGDGFQAGRDIGRFIPCQHDE